VEKQTHTGEPLNAGSNSSRPAASESHPVLLPHPIVNQVSYPLQDASFTQLMSAASERTANPECCRWLT
jgi:hypothetical protein